MRLDEKYEIVSQSFKLYGYYSEANNEDRYYTDILHLQSNNFGQNNSYNYIGMFFNVCGGNTVISFNVSNLKPASGATVKFKFIPYDVSTSTLDIDSSQEFTRTYSSTDYITGPQLQPLSCYCVYATFDKKISSPFDIGHIYLSARIVPNSDMFMRNDGYSTFDGIYDVLPGEEE